MDNNFQAHILHVNSYEIRKETHQGQPHIVVPVIMMVEGVHSANNGPLYYPADELGKVPASWNGIPISIEHPREGGDFIPCNSPGVIDAQVVGKVFNTQFVDGKLRAECWLNQSDLTRISPQALAYINEGRPLEVSVGCFSDNDPAQGQWHGEEYIAIARNHRPDHLALLPGGTGACSWADGCGIRANSNCKRNHRGGENSVNEELIKARKELILQGHLPFQANETGFKEIIHSLQTQLDAMDNPVKVHYLTEVFEKDFIFEVVPTAMGGPAPPSTFLRRTYETNEDGSIEMTGEPEMVTREVNFVASEEEEMKRTKGGDTTVTNNGKCVQCIDSLIAHEGTKFTEKDREWLAAQDEEILDKLVPNDPVVALEKDEDKQLAKKEEVILPAGDTDAVAALTALQEELNDPEKFKGHLPKDIQEQMAFGLKLHQERKDQMITRITANSDVYTKEDLVAMDIDALTKLNQHVKPVVSFVPNLGGSSSQGGIEPLVPAAVLRAEAAAKK